MIEFQNVVSYCGLSEMVYTGPQFTWTNHRVADPIGKKLDRALINGAWLALFPYSFASFEAGGIHDHARCVVQVAPYTSSCRIPFKFFNFIKEHAQFLETSHRV